MHAFGIKGGPIMGHILVRVLQRFFQTHQLQGLQFVLTGGFDRFQIAWLGVARMHGCLHCFLYLSGLMRADDCAFELM